MLRPELVTQVSSNGKETRKTDQRLRQRSKRFAELYPGDVVRMQPLCKKTTEWEKATVLRQAGPRSYSVRTEEGGVFRRNRRQLRLTQEKMEEQEPLENTQQEEKSAEERCEEGQQHLAEDQPALKFR